MRLLLLAVVAGCYEPDLASCKVTCGSTDNCAHGQTCADGFCVSAGDTCNPEGPLDGPTATRMLHVMIMGNGSVTVANAGTCKDDCMYALADGATISATWIETSGGHPFKMWTTPNCMAQGQTCAFTLSMPNATLGAMFQ
jgi:hypothetical protein